MFNRSLNLSAGTTVEMPLFPSKVRRASCDFFVIARDKGFRVRRVTCERNKCGKPLYGWEDGTRKAERT
jgi:predicted lipoprotein with Yx(FWY)xxD motif